MTHTATADRAVTRPLSQSAEAPSRRPVVLTRLALIASGVGFVLYPALRPFSDETSLEGARAFASPAWVWAHSIGIVSFLLLGLGLTGWTFQRLIARPGDRRALTGLTLAWIGIGLTLPYYGAEVFGLHALGEAAVNGDAAAMEIVGSVRWEQGLWFILLGLTLLATAVVTMAVTVWRSESRRWLGLPLAAAMLLYIPQFGTGQPIRVAHGLLVLIGCLCLSMTVAGERR